MLNVHVSMVIKINVSSFNVLNGSTISLECGVTFLMLHVGSKFLA